MAGCKQLFYRYTRDVAAGKEPRCKVWIPAILARLVGLAMFRDSHTPEMHEQFRQYVQSVQPPADAAAEHIGPPMGAADTEGLGDTLTLVLEPEDGPAVVVHVCFEILGAMHACCSDDVSCIVPTPRLCACSGRASGYLHHPRRPFCCNWIQANCRLVHGCIWGRHLAQCATLSRCSGTVRHGSASGWMPFLTPTCTTCAERTVAERLEQSAS